MNTTRHPRRARIVREPEPAPTKPRPKRRRKRAPSLFIITVRELAAVLGVSERAAYRIKNAPGFPARRVVPGMTTPVLLRSDIEAWKQNLKREFE